MVWEAAIGCQVQPAAKSVFAKRLGLYWWDEVPAVLQFNPYIKSGYRAGVPVLSVLHIMKNS